MKTKQRRVGRPPGETPKYQSIRELVRGKILDGTYAPGFRLPPDLEFHKDLQVNKLTAIRALNDLAREGLLVRRRGSGTYVADVHQPPLLPGRNVRLGLLSKCSVSRQNLWKTFEGAIVRGALSVLGLGDAALEWQACAAPQTVRAVWNLPRRGVTAVWLGESCFSEVRHPPLEDVRAGHFDGLVCVSIIEHPWLEALLALGRPAVLADALDERFALRADQVFVDPFPAHRAAVRYLAGIGARRIHFVAGYMSLPAPAEEMSRQEVSAFRGKRMRVDPDSYLRLSAFRQAMDECGLPAPEAYVHFRNPMEETPRQLALRLAELPQEQRPQAVVCHSNGVANEMIAAFAERGLPLLGTGSSQQSGAGPAWPIHIDGQELGAAAVELLLSRLQRPSRSALRVGVPMLFDAARAGGAPPVAAPAALTTGV